MNKPRTEIIVAIIGLCGVVLTALISNWTNIFSNNGAKHTEVVQVEKVVYSQSRTCEYTKGPKKGSIQYFSPKEYPIINPAVIGQPCTDGAGNWGIAIENLPDQQ